MNVKVTAILLLIFWGAISPALAFLPNTFLAWTVRSLEPSLDSVSTHKDMTRNAILEVAAGVLGSYPNPSNSASSAQISALASFSERSLTTAYYGQRQDSRRRNFQAVIEAISYANADVDLNRNKRIDAAAHFDSEQFLAGQNRLIRKRRIVVAQIILSSNFERAHRETGQILHTLQDFYSHSNWIENGNSLPYQPLGRENERLSNAANDVARTCNDCEEGRTQYQVKLFNTISKISNPYNCENNIVQDLENSNMLTTGYHSGQLNEYGLPIVKPFGKCSHGGFLDTTSEMSATGGINKDSPYHVWSPHHYLYEEAVRVAQRATIDFLSEIRNDIKDDNLFSTFLGVPIVEDSTQSISIAYVIDTTGSMGEELPQIQATLPIIRSNLTTYVNSFGGGVQVRYILVPFNDPGMPLFKSVSKMTLLLERKMKRSACFELPIICTRVFGVYIQQCQ